MTIFQGFALPRAAFALLASASLLFGASSAQASDETLPDIRFCGGQWIELSPVIVAAKKFYPGNVSICTGGVVSLTKGEADIVTNAETQLLRESMVNPDLRLIMTVTESFYRIVAKRSSGIKTLADLKGKRVVVPGPTSAGYFLEAMLRSVGLSDDDVTLVPFPRGPDINTSMDMMSDLMVNGEADAIAIWEPEPVDAIADLGDDAIVLQDRNVYREVFSLYTTAQQLKDPERRKAVIGFVRAIRDATHALQDNPEPYWPMISEQIGFSVPQIEGSWHDMQFPVHIVPDILDVLEVEDKWVAGLQDREPRSRDDLRKFVDYSVLEEALAGGVTHTHPHTHTHTHAHTHPAGEAQ